jgi:hypothetical protein
MQVIARRCSFVRYRDLASILVVCRCGVSVQLIDERIAPAYVLFYTCDVLIYDEKRVAIAVTE